MKTKMKIVAFAQARNESEQGNLVRYLENIKKVTDEICIVDDCSTDDSMEIYQKYTDKENIIQSPQRMFGHELFLKAALLPVALKHNPDWLIWTDIDTILSRSLTERCREILQDIEIQGYDGAYLHNLNLWRHPAFYRIDNGFNGLSHLVFWRNNGNLHYQPYPGLHQAQFPKGMKKLTKLDGLDSDHFHELLHFGFASEQNIARKYLTYKGFGQSGWALDRLIDEKTSFELKKVPKELFPDGNVPEDYDTVQVPQPLDYGIYRQYQNWEDFNMERI